MMRPGVRLVQQHFQRRCVASQLRFSYGAASRGPRQMHAPSALLPLHTARASSLLPASAPARRLKVVSAQLISTATPTSTDAGASRVYACSPGRELSKAFS
jgi:hypothetical protein